MSEARIETGNGRGRPLGKRKVNLTARVSEGLRNAIVSGAVAIGEKLPSEASLTTEYKVSRTVVREAIALLRADGMVESRQGSGLYVVSRGAIAVPVFPAVDQSRISSMIEFLELRAAVEIEAAGLASQRRSPAQEEAIFEGCEAIEATIEAGGATAEDDFRLHLKIADATNNVRFREFLEMVGARLIPRRALQDGQVENTPAHYLEQIQKEHRTIAEAISQRDEARARDAMRGHLQGSRDRYRQLLRGV